ncbi:hypothetical protein KEM55_002928 [Ascosphaera atra]|nr:hypothetical protein KEM55_002928 [Ascosphaera atra]
MATQGDIPEEGLAAPVDTPVAEPSPAAAPADTEADTTPADQEEKPLKSAMKKGTNAPPATTGGTYNTERPELPAQPDPETLDLSTLTPLTPEIIARQATINIGTIGHVAHGKSTVVKAISGVQTVRFKNEQERNITIKLGYANAKIYKCDNPACPRPTCYRSYPSQKEVDPPCEREGCGGTYRLLRHVSFVDCPGHDILMSTMLSGAAVMDAALLLIAGNESCPQPQTSEHLAAIEIMKLNHIVILQNKVDLYRQRDRRGRGGKKTASGAARILVTAPAEEVSVQREAIWLFAKEKERVCPVGWKNDEGRVGSLYVSRVIRMFQDDFFASLFVDMVSCPGFDLDELQLVLLDEYTAKWES